jgi:nitroreductase
MSIQDLIKKRRSITPEQFNTKKIDDKTIDILLESANWAPTHKKTEPWRFKIVTGNSKIKFGEFLAKKYKQNTTKFSEYKFKKLLEKPNKASHVLLICMQRDQNESVPEWEEVAAVSMAVQNLWLTATDLNIGGYWSSPSFINQMNEFTELNLGEKCLGIFYLGYHDNNANERIPGSIKNKVKSI